MPLTQERLFEIHDYLDQLTQQRGYFREALAATGLTLTDTPLHPMVVYELRPQVMHLGFSVDPALNARAPEPELRRVAAECVLAVKKEFPETSEFRFDLGFIYGGPPEDG